MGEVMSSPPLWFGEGIASRVVDVCEGLGGLETLFGVLGWPLPIVTCYIHVYHVILNYNI